MDDPLSISNLDRDGRVLADETIGIAGEGKDLVDFEVEDFGSDVS